MLYFPRYLLVLVAACITRASVVTSFKRVQIHKAPVLNGELPLRRSRLIHSSQNIKLPRLRTSARKANTLCSISLQAKPHLEDIAPTSTDSAASLNVKIQPTYMIIWLALLIFAFGFAPGEIGSQEDNDLIMKLISDPLAGDDVNRLWFAVWNFFAVVPATLACLLLPVERKDQWLPAGPFVFSSAFLGFFTLGPYVFLQDSTRSQGVVDSFKESVITDIFESRIFGIGLAILACSIPFVSGLFDAITADAASVLSGYADLFTTSRFVSVATADICILTAVASSLIPNDLKLRRPDKKKGKYDVAVAMLTLLIPAVGSALYIALRPPLIKDQ
mmetsp:Transcript_20065/g.28550  ORF Transcript_20065/g.28550 Transcript_20065/m.28550 type:complete len:332 (-) Transcript_20065:1017-2012(-)